MIGDCPLREPKQLKPENHCVVVLGASPKPTRYSYQAVKLLHAQGYRVIPVHPKTARIDHVPVVSQLAAIREPVNTLTLYVGAERSRGMIKDILELAPGRVIFNPGTESRELELALKDTHIPYERACTLVLLRTGQF
jgi:predicted CoA-binding protein